MIEAKGKLYLAYGSNLNLEQMTRRCPTAEVVGVSVLENWRLLFRGSHGGAVATVERSAGGSVPVLVWDIQPKDEVELDIYEGWPRLYRKETLQIKLDGKTVSAMLYIMNEGHPEGGPGPYYYDTILNGYKSAGFDTNILQADAERSRRRGVKRSGWNRG